jgi:hypothetical protein
VTDINSIQNCTLYFDSVLNQTNTSITRNIDQNFTEINVPSSDTLSWKIGCTDLVNRTTNSSAFRLDTYHNPNSPSGGYSGKKYTYDSLEGLFEEKTGLKKGDKIMIPFKEETHQIKIDYIKSDYVTVTVSSDPTTKDIYFDNPENFDLDSDGNYDLTLTLNEIQSYRANILFEEYKVQVTSTTCTENWSCTEWSECTNENQIRTCTDQNYCGRTIEKPIETQECKETGKIQESPEEVTKNYFWIGWTLGILAVAYLIYWYFFKKEK